MNENNKNSEENGKEKRVLRRLAKEMMQLWISKMHVELYGQGKAIRSRAMELMGLWIAKLTEDNRSREMMVARQEWEYENDLFQDSSQQYNWDFMEDNL
jgi:hypothetical protein